MRFSDEFLVVFLSLLVCGWALQRCHGRTFGFDLHHKFSEPVRQWMSLRHGIGTGEWPEKGSEDYYVALFHHDRNFRGRGLSGKEPVTFSDGNATIRINSLGFLHYTSVSLGTPSKTFLVAIDTGSDLFWVPCDCNQCASASPLSYGYDFEFSIYSPNTSITSNPIYCKSSLCEVQSQCSGSTSHCPYKVAYVSADTSSSGVLVDDVLYLTTEDGDPVIVKARIIFGCGQVQTGSFLDAAAPNGLFGLGMEKISVPSILASKGLIADSFSMCFGHDGIGRISFGDKGSSDQEETPFNVNQLRPTYNVTVTEVHVGTSLIDPEFSVLVDSGTSFTYFADPVYTRLSKSFNSQTLNNRHQPDSRIPFEYCYDISSDDNLTTIPNISLTMKGGGHFPVLDPIIIITNRVQVMYCLAIAKSHDLNIIGQNFMTGHRIVFDREKLVLGWKKFNCYDIEDSNTLPITPSDKSALPPTVAVGPTSYTPEATKETTNRTQASVLPPPSINHAPHLSYGFRFTALMLILFFLAIF